MTQGRNPMNRKTITIGKFTHELPGVKNRRLLGQDRCIAKGIRFGDGMPRGELADCIDLKTWDFEFQVLR